MKFNTLTFQGDILIVDDLVDNLRILSDTLSTQGHRVRAVRDGAMALVGAKAAPPDVILLDVRMPNMDGFEVCQRLKADPTTQHIPIIFLSALDDAVDKSRAFEAGAVDYITKPFQAVEVQARVQHHLTLQQLQNQVAAQQAQLDTLTRQTVTQTEVCELSQTTATRAIDTILAYAERLGQNPRLKADQKLCVQELERYGQAMHRLLSILDD